MNPSPPSFSIVVPTFNRPDQLRECLLAISNLNYPRESFETIIVDDESPSPLDAVTAEFESKIDLELIRQRHAGPATARNTGAAAARNEFVVFTDDDCAPFADWLTKLAERFRAYPKDHAIGGRVINHLKNNPYSTASQLLVDYLYSYYNEPGGARFFNSSNIAFPVKTFLEMGGFDTTFPRAAAEDRELCTRWLKSGRYLMYEPEAKVSHSHRLSFGRFVRQHFNYGSGAFRFHQILAYRKESPVPVEPPSFYWNLLRYPFGQDVSNPVSLTTLLAITQVANAAGFFWAKLHPKTP